MKTPRLLFPLLTLAACVAPTVPVFAEEKDPVAESGFAPKEYPLSRYAPLDKKSPFEFDPPPVKTDETVNPFEGVSLAGYAGSGKNLTVYLIGGGKEKQRLTVYGDGSPFKKRDKSGYRVVTLHAAKTLKKTSVTLEKDGVQGEVFFDAETLKPKATGQVPGQNMQMVQGPDGRMVPRQIVPRPTGAAAGQNQQPYVAPAPFIPGQNKPPQNPQQNQQPGVNNVNNGQQPQTLGTMNNQQLVNHLTGPNGQPLPGNPNVAPQPGAMPPGGDQPRVTVPPQRRRVVLPTQQ